jgi:transmembrane sensor
MENISKYFEDKRFIEWIFSNGDHLDRWWKNYQASNPDEKQNIQKAKNILQHLRTDNRKLSEHDKILLFTRILRQVEDKERKSTRMLAALMKYAAVAVLFFAIGALLFYKQDNFNPQFFAHETPEPVNPNEAQLIRPHGESISLKEKKSVIEYKQDGQVVVNNDILESTPIAEKGVPEMNQLVIPYGKTSEIKLPDGTIIFLNAGSRLIYPEFFVDKNREVFLVGEAFFEVSHDNNQPFVVQTTDIRIKVMGTSFNVSAYPTDNIIETVLTEGKVRLEHNNSRLFDESIELIPGHLAAFNKTNKETGITRVDTENHTLWKDGMYKFESTDLSRVIKKLERFYNIRFAYDDPFLGTIKISGKLGLSEDRQTIIDNLATAADVRIIKKGDDYYEISK